MMCSCSACRKQDDDGACTIYTIEGQAFRQRMGYCPVIDNNPERDRQRKIQQKIRIGQQKQRRRK